MDAKNQVANTRARTPQNSGNRIVGTTRRNWLESAAATRTTMMVVVRCAWWLWLACFLDLSHASLRCLHFAIRFWTVLARAFLLDGVDGWMVGWFGCGILSNKGETRNGDGETVHTRLLPIASTILGKNSERRVALAGGRTRTWILAGSHRRRLFPSRIDEHRGAQVSSNGLVGHRGSRPLWLPVSTIHIDRWQTMAISADQ